MSEVIHILGGGTVFHVRPHLALSAPAYGQTARELAALCEHSDREVQLHLTKMGNGGRGIMETNADVDSFLKTLIKDPSTKIIFMTVALCDYEGSILESDPRIPPRSGKDQPRLHSSHGPQVMALMPAEKLIGQIRKERKDIYLVGFKTTAGATEDEQYLAGLTLLKSTSCNLVLANDLHTKLNLIVAPELARYAVTKDRSEALRQLVDMVDRRSRLSFTRTTLKEGELVRWTESRIPSILRTVVEWCVDNGAYKPFRDVTVGHFAYREAPGILVSSRRRRNFNKFSDRDLVRVEIRPGEMIAYGAKPSAGTPSQYAVLSQFPEFDCIIHFHCVMRPDSKIQVRPQKDLECGSAECGENTWKGMNHFGNLAAVMLDKHGPNIIFSSKGNAQEVIDFIDQNFDLSTRTDGIKD